MRCTDWFVPLTARVRRHSRAISRLCALAVLLVSVGATRAHGDIGVVLNESLDESVAKVTSAGHSAVYFSRICPESPVKLRLCRPDELGSVLSNYTTLGEDEPYQWNAAPLSIYLYGAEDPRFRPLIGLPEVKRELEERYRETHLAQYCASEFCKTSNKPEWRFMVGATLERSLYIFVVHTSVEQDLAFIKQFNSSPNVNHFNGVTRNCATFVRGIVDFYYPHAAHADYLNDFMMVSPKAIARSFTRWALHHPEMNLRILHFAQLPGTIKRSSEPRSGTEQFCRSKKFYPPMVWFAPYGMPAAAGAYYLTGRFNPERQLEHHPAFVDVADGQEIDPVEFLNDEIHSNDPPADQHQERVPVFGTAEEWKQYHTDFDGIVDEAVGEKIIPGREYIDQFAKQLQEKGKLVLDPSGAMWMEIEDGKQSKRLGISANNILDSASNSQFAYSLLLERVNHMLKCPKHQRESMPEFLADWQLMESGRTRIWESYASAATSAQGPRPILVAARP